MTNRSASKRKGRQSAVAHTQLSVKHEACGGQADLTISIGPGTTTYNVHCHQCGYTESWSDGQAPRQLLH
jgi:hypothetical protein